MEYVIIGLLLLIILLIIILFIKQKNNENIVERLSKIEVNMVKEIGDFKLDFSHNINDDFNTLNEKIDYRLRLISDKVNERLDENF